MANGVFGGLELWFFVGWVATGFPPIMTIR